jgi:activating signal cointegrator 1
MKALTLTQPWATLVAIGAKKIETRSWRTDYRGPLAIHAAKGFPEDAQALCFLEPFATILRNAKVLQFPRPGKYNRFWKEKIVVPRGCVIATCQLVRIDGPLGKDADIYFTRNERAFGDLSEGRYAWFLADIKPLPQPVPARGFQGLWDWDGQP